ncbi:MAG: peptide MFS transporter [Parasphingorhabdus sp.]|uniref:peptide MFS transporter n=1 Tax=Parasphingorhabdus sp. TaxID=2709688 RepID=UPI0030039CB0
MGDSTIKAAEQDSVFLGHPRGLAYLAFTEMWERFSFYGMQSLLVLYMTQELFLPGHIEHVAGMGWYRSLLEGAYGPLSPLALAGQTFGLYAGLVYFTPLIGGWIADRWLGAKRTVIIGVLLMTAGHAAMALDQSFLIALMLLIMGSGALKGNIASQVGQLYSKDDDRPARGFVIFSTAINIGAIGGPLACGLLAQIYGWHVGFSTAGLLMLVALGVYLKGLPHLPEEPHLTRTAAVSVKLTTADWRSVGILMIFLVFQVLLGPGYDQQFNMGMVWIDAAVDLQTPFGPVPVAWFVSINSFGTVLGAFAAIGFWRWQAKRGREQSDNNKMVFGGLMYGAGTMLLAIGSAVQGPGSVNIVFPVLSYFITGVAFTWSWPTWLAIMARYAPRQIAARMMAAAYLVVFFGSIIAGYFSRFYETMDPALFWALNAVACWFGAALYFVFGPMLTRALDRDMAHEPDFALRKQPA